MAGNQANAVIEGCFFFTEVQTDNTQGIQGQRLGW
jgi:hypothetical protein